MQPDVRPSPLAGRWYPADADALHRLITHYMRVDVQPRPSTLAGLVAPHAGLRYSGPVAGHAFAHLNATDYDTVVVIGPSHYPYNAPLLTTAHTAYETPLGRVPVAGEVVHQLTESLRAKPVHDDPEHAIEIELPFLQVALADFELVPLAMLDQSREMAQRVAEALLVSLAGRRALFVASSDLSHFYDQATANKLDQTILDALTAYDPDAILDAEHDGRGLACGRGAIAAVLLALAGGSARVEAYATSGDVSGDVARVVGYVAATVWPA